MKSKIALPSLSRIPSWFGAAFCTTFVFCGSASSGEPIQVKIHESQGLFSVYAEAYLSAKPENIWINLTSCARATDFVPFLISCRVLSQDKKLQWDIRENISAPPLQPKIRTVIRNEFRQNEFSYHLISGDLNFSEGYWKLNQSMLGTRVVYFARFEPPTFTPRFLLSKLLRQNVIDMLTKLDRLSE
jgi:Polyketide cyclase / dehydrase and lipid transport